VVVTFSVLAQGSLVPAVVHLLKLPSRTTELEPWTLGGPLHCGRRHHPGPRRQHRRHLDQHRGPRRPVGHRPKEHSAASR
jgi:hypothetical protein